MLLWGIRVPEIASRDSYKIGTITETNLVWQLGRVGI